MHEYAREAQMSLLSHIEQLGSKETLLKVIERFLEKKFGAKGLALVPVIQQLKLAALEQLLNAFIDATSPATSPAEIWSWLERERGKEARMPFLSYPEQIGYKKAIGRALEKKFGAEGLALVPAIQQQEPAVLQQLLDALITATSPAELRDWLAARQPS
jgi:hypothetical protein